MEGLICTVYLDRNEFGALEVVIRTPNDTEHRDELRDSRFDADAVWYALLHEGII